MPAADSQLPDVSICIPTRNRAALLNRCLSHLLTFSSIKIEVIVGDNGSTDDTTEIVRGYADKFSRLTYLKHDTDVGVVRNVHSTLIRARARYAYVLSDDDIVFENGLALLKAELDASPGLAAISGTYIGTDAQPDVGTNRTYGPVKHFRIARGNFLALADNFLLSDGYPLIRMQIFRRHCLYHERGFGLIPLFSQLLAHGDISFTDQPIFLHFQNQVSLTMKLPEPWFLDFCDADFEVAFAHVRQPLPAGKLNQMRADFRRITYLQSARMCRIQKNYPLMWHFLSRAKAVGGVTDACLVLCEQHFLLQVVLLRIGQLIADAATKRIWVRSTPMLLLMKAQLQEMLPAVEFSWFEGGAGPDEPEICLVEVFETGNAVERVAPTMIAFYDVLANMRLTQQKIGLITEGAAIKVAVSSQHGDDRDFAMLMNDYGMPAK